MFQDLEEFDSQEELALPWDHPSVAAWELTGHPSDLADNLYHRGLEGEELDTVAFFQQAINLLKHVANSGYLQSENSYTQMLLGVELEQLNYYTQQINARRTPLPLKIPNPQYVFVSEEGVDYSPY